MSEQQRKEIETIKERNIKLKLSDADCKRILDLTASHNISIAELLESFIGDLVDGTYTNGSDERDRAQSYFERCYFGMYPEKTFINYLIEWGEIENYINTLEAIEDAKEELEADINDMNDQEAWKDFTRQIRDEQGNYKTINVYKSYEDFKSVYEEYVADDRNALESEQETLESYYKDYVSNFTPDFDSKAPQPKAEALEGVKKYISNYEKLMEGDTNK